MEKIAITIDVTYDGDNPPIDQLTSKIDDLISRNASALAPNKEDIDNFNVTVTDWRARVENSAEDSKQFIADIDKHLSLQDD